MSVIDTIANDAFTPYRGTDEMIQRFPIRNGAVYFAYDTLKIYFDANGERHTMSGDGIRFVYGNGSDVVIDPETNYYKFPIDFIKSEHFFIDNIIINKDGTFYKIRDIDDLYAYCDKLLVSGSGGGGTDSGLKLNVIKKFPAVYPYGESITGTFKIFDPNEGATGTVTITIKDSKDSLVDRKVSFLSADVGPEFEIKINADDLKPGENNYIILSLEVDGVVASSVRTFSVNCVNLAYKPTSAWNPCKIINSTDSIVFPYQLVAGEGSTIPNDIKVNVSYLLDNMYISEEIVTADKAIGAHDLKPLFAHVNQGGHNLKVTAYADIGNVNVCLADLYYGVGYSTGDKDSQPFIWSPYPSESKVENYTIIDIPYNAYDPVNTDRTVTIDKYVNGVSQGTEIITYNETQWQHFIISEYNVGEINNFMLQSKDTWLNFLVEIVKNYQLNLDVTTGSALYLNAVGRKNTETAAKRATWPNKITDVVSAGLNLGDVEFKNFNWANNGWITSDQGDCLRVSNGASVKIPITSMSSEQAQNRTYEFDFYVRNATDYSRLINDVEVNEVDEFGNIKYDQYGSPIKKVEKQVSTGEGAFLTYYDVDAKKGYMLGTQEAFFGISATDVVNVRYTDEQRVKVSIVVDAEGKFTKICNESGAETGTSIPMIYIYINGVLTNIMSFKLETSFSTTLSAIEINSKYCDVDIFGIRIYPDALSYQQITQNWVGDAPTLQIKKARYAINQAIVKDNQIDYTLVHNSEDITIPTMVITTHDVNGVTEADNKLPYQKGNKKVVSVRYYDPLYPEKNFHCQNVELDVQGTSSQGYPRRNYKLKTKKKIDETNVNWKLPFRFETWDGLESNKNYWYQDDPNVDANTAKSKKLKKIDIGNGVPETNFCLKADYMESSSTHNTQFANLIQEIADGSYASYDFRHPLNKDFGKSVSYRTTVYGYPILLFWENASGEISFVGKYNFNIDKSATTSFGFSIKETNPYSETTTHKIWGKDENGDDILTDDPDGPRQSTFEELCECWELTQNQSGLGKFQGTDFFEVAPETSANAGRLLAYDHFENRYHYMDFDAEEIYTKAGSVGEANETFKSYLGNLAKMWAWVNSTDTRNATNEAFDSPVYYPTISTVYEKGIQYYKADADETAIITPKYTYEYQQEDSETTVVVVQNKEAFESLMSLVYPDATEMEDKLGVYTFVKDEDGLYYLTDNEVKYEATTYGLVLPENFTKDLFSIKVGIEYSGFSQNLREQFQNDNIRYRKAKFKNEFKLHFDLPYTLLYFIMTELMLAYDSRQKNMMLATWGPKELGGEYIWYPIFYDIDTQLGVNNSGYMTWDYDTDASIVEEEADGKYKDSSIFSGAGSVLWINFYMLFNSNIKDAYRELREAGSISYKTLNDRYNVHGADQWSEIMKNIDSDYKYISPATTGYTNQSGEWAQTNMYYYCLQGDRTLNRAAFFRNRLNYIDSEWLAGSYNPSKTSGAQIKMRYNANDRTNTSDSDDGSENATYFNANATFNLKAYLSQFLSVIYDETATKPAKFISGETDQVVIDPPDSIKTRLDEGVPLSQQLAYIRGPEYISDLGDLSMKYLNEFDYSNAKRLRRLQLGSMKDGYKNLGFTNTEWIGSSAGTTSEKGLLNYMDISNLSKLSGTLDITGCLKIETFKALGTALSLVNFTEGSLLKTIYLPKTIETLILLQPTGLKGLITTKPTFDTQPEGLYVENLTDKITNGVDATTSCRINKMKLTDTKLGIDSYKILRYLYLVKNSKKSGLITDANTTDNLRFDIYGVDWTPFRKVEIDQVWNSELEGNYYILTNDTNYEAYTHSSNDTFNNYVADGVMFIKDPAYDSTTITSLDMLDTFIEQYTNDSYVIANGSYRFRSTVDDPTDASRKILPVITGEMHINNRNENAIEEIDLFNKYGLHYPNLHITVDNMNPAQSAHFVEYDETGAKKSLYWQKADLSTSTAISYGGEAPRRLHYDFAGWVISDSTTSAELRAKHSVVEDSDSYTIIPTNSLSNYNIGDYANNRVELIGVYRLHGYKMTFICDGEVFAERIIPAGSSITPPENVPYRPSIDPNEYALEEINHFIGWHISNDSTTDVTELDRILASEELTFYAKFEKANVYNHPLTSDDLIMEKGTYRGTEGLYVGLKKSKGIKGKICFPKTATYEGNTYNVIGFLQGTILNDDSSNNNGLSWNQDIYAIFFEGCNQTPHTSNMLDIGMFACYEMRTLCHIDIPDSLINIGQSAFTSCKHLVINDINNVRVVGSYAFQDAGTDADNTYITLRGGSSYNNYNTGCFTDGSWAVINLGTLAHPIDASNISSWTASGQIIGISAESEQNLIVQEVNVTYNPNSVSTSDIDEMLSTIMIHFDYHAGTPNFINYLTSTAIS